MSCRVSFHPCPLTPLLSLPTRIGGEDPTLGRIMSRAFTEGFQTRLDNRSRYRMVNTIAKHLNTYGGPE